MQFLVFNWYLRRVHFKNFFQVMKRSENKVFEYMMIIYIDNTRSLCNWNSYQVQHYVGELANNTLVTYSINFATCIKALFNVYSLTNFGVLVIRERWNAGCPLLLFGRITLNISHNLKMRMQIRLKLVWGWLLSALNEH